MAHRITMLLALLSVACGSREAAPPRCTPGSSASCSCTYGRAGAQRCSERGDFGPCVCEAALPPAGEEAPEAAAARGCALATGAHAQAPLAHVRSALGAAASALVETCAERDVGVSADALGAAFDACPAEPTAPGAFEACGPEGQCCRVGVSSLVGPPGDGEGSWVVFRAPMGVADYTEHVYWLPPDGSRVERLCAWAPYLLGCPEEGDLLDVEGCDMTPRQWAEIGYDVRRFLCQAPMP